MIVPFLLGTCDNPAGSAIGTDARAAAGSFGYSISERFAGAYELQIDTNDDGSYEHPPPRLTGAGLPLLGARDDRT